MLVTPKAAFGQIKVPVSSSLDFQLHHKKPRRQAFSLSWDEEQAVNNCALLMPLFWARWMRLPLGTFLSFAPTGWQLDAAPCTDYIVFPQKLCLKDTISTRFSSLCLFQEKSLLRQISSVNDSCFAMRMHYFNVPCGLHCCLTLYQWLLYWSDLKYAVLKKYFKP